MEDKEFQKKLAGWEANKPVTKQLVELEKIAKEIEKIVKIMNYSGNKGEKGMADLGSLLIDIRESLDDLVSKEAPESPDYAKPVVDAVSKLEKALTASIKAVDVKPQVNVQSPNVKVDTPKIDLSGVEKVLKGDIPSAFAKAIKGIPKTEIDHKPLIKKFDAVLDLLAEIDTGVRLKPQPGIMKVTNSDGTKIGSDYENVDNVVKGVITIQNANPAGKATGNSAVEITLGKGQNTIAFQTVGTYTGALTLQGTVDGYNWISFAGTPILNANTGLYLATVTSALQSVFAAKVSGYAKVRLTAGAAVTGQVTVTIAASTGDSFQGALGVLTSVTTVTTLTNITNWGNVVDNGAFVDGTTRLMPGGYIFDEVAGTALTENDAAAARIDSKRAQINVLEDATTRGQRAGVNAAGGLKVDPSAITMPTTLLSFVTDIPTAGVRVQLASNTVTNGFIIQAPSTNTGVIYVGGSTVSSTVYGAELQAGQSTSVMVDNTNKIYVDTDVSGSDVAVLGT